MKRTGIILMLLAVMALCAAAGAEEDIFRPAAWNAFGMDKEGQDFRACQAYGPLYRTIR